MKSRNRGLTLPLVLSAVWETVGREEDKASVLGAKFAMAIAVNQHHRSLSSAAICVQTREALWIEK